MCGRYYISTSDADGLFAGYIIEARERAERMGLALSCNGEIFPTHIVPVIATGAAHRTIGAYPMQWGFSHPTRGLRVINTRSETAAEKPLFRASIADRRCLIPASWYFEWKKLENGKKERYALHGADGAPLFLAGLYLRDSSGGAARFSILTRDAADPIKGIHNRMPVILPRERMADWLSPKNDYAELVGSAILDVRACVG